MHEAFRVKGALRLYVMHAVNTCLHALLYSNIETKTTTYVHADMLITYMDTAYWYIQAGRGMEVGTKASRRGTWLV
jgi:hypothetical protein